MAKETKQQQAVGRRAIKTPRLVLIHGAIASSN